MPSRPLVELVPHGNLRVLSLDNPPVNAISWEVAAALEAAFDAFEANTRARALIIACRGPTFIVGGDLRLFDARDFPVGGFNRFLDRLEASTRPVIAAMHGTVLGGGLELAMACHWRLAAPGTTFGLPELAIGMIPGSLGTQRLPRLIGLRHAFELIASGRRLDVAQALELGLLDGTSPAEPPVDPTHHALVDAPLHRPTEPAVRSSGLVVDAALTFARRVLEGDLTPPRTSRRKVVAAPEDEAAMRAALTPQHGRAGHALVEALLASQRPFEEGAAVEARLFEALRTSREAAALRRLFFAERAAMKKPASTVLSRCAVLAHHPGSVVEPLVAAARAQGFELATLACQREADLERWLEENPLALNEYVLALDLALSGALDNPRVLPLSSTGAAQGERTEPRLVGFRWSGQPARVAEVVSFPETSPLAAATVTAFARNLGLAVVPCRGASVSARLAAARRAAIDELVGGGETPEAVQRALERFSRVEREPSDDALAHHVACEVVDAAVRLLQEGVVRSAAELDLVSTSAGFPRHEGGPLFWADAHGLATVVEHLLARRSSPAPARLLIEHASRGEAIASWQSGRRTASVKES